LEDGSHRIRKKEVKFKRGGCPNGEEEISRTFNIFFMLDLARVSDEEKGHMRNRGCKRETEGDGKMCSWIKKTWFQYREARKPTTVDSRQVMRRQTTMEETRGAKILLRKTILKDVQRA